MRRALPHLCALLCGVVAALVVGCGDRSNLIPGADASRIKDDLAQAQQAIASGDCAAAGAAVLRARRDALALPPTVDRRLRSRLNDGIASLRQTAPKDCLAAKTQTTPTTTETTPTETTTTTVPTTTQTVPTTTATTPTETTPTTTPTDTTPTTPSTTSPDGGGTGGAPGDAQP